MNRNKRLLVVIGLLVSCSLFAMQQHNMHQVSNVVEQTPQLECWYEGTPIAAIPVSITEKISPVFKVQ